MSVKVPPSGGVSPSSSPLVYGTAKGDDLVPRFFLRVHELEIACRRDAIGRAAVKAHPSPEQDFRFLRKSGSSSMLATRMIRASTSSDLYSTSPLG
jgi:hypothetical protein